MVVERPGREQLCTIAFSCANTCGPYQQVGHKAFVIYDLGQVQGIGLLHIQLKIDVSFNVRLLGPDLNVTCHTHVFATSASPPPKVIVATCRGNSARFIKIETVDIGASIDICFFNYFLQGRKFSNS